MFARVVASAAVCAIALQAVDAFAADPKPGFSGTIAIEEGYTDNLRAERDPRADAWYTQVGGELTLQRKPRGWLPHRLGGLARFRLYPGYGNRDYAEFGPQLGYDWKLLDLTLDYRLSPDKLQTDPDSAVGGFADVHELPLELRTKLGARREWLVTLELKSEWDLYDDAFRARTFFEEQVEVGLRCHVWKWVTPRAAASYTYRDANSSNFDRDEIELLAAVEVPMPGSVRAWLRYEHTWRNYNADAPEAPDGKRNSNYGREDDEDSVEAGLDLPVPYLEEIRTQLRYRYTINDSTREDRNYFVNEAFVRLVYFFD